VALANGDFATFGTEMKTVGTLLTQLQQITGTSAAPNVSASPTPKASPTPSPR
jgi:hypothetical protein